MSRQNPFDPVFEQLPDTLPIFPLSGVMLLPGGKLPLNVFEPRYLAMIFDSLAGHRLIGMVQPMQPACFTASQSVDRPRPRKKAASAAISRSRSSSTSSSAWSRSAR